MDRRSALLVIASAGVGGYLAERRLGVLEESSGNDPPDTDTPSSTPESNDTPDEQDEPGDTGDVTPSNGGSDNLPAYNVGETFELASVEYRVRGAWQADELGRSTNPLSPDGVFVVVSVRVENGRSDFLSFPGSIFRLRQANSWAYRDEKATEAATADDRVQPDGWIDESIASGNGQTGVAAFEAKPNEAAELWFLSPDDGEDSSVLVPIGKPSQLDFLQGIVTG